MGHDDPRELWHPIRSDALSRSACADRGEHAAGTVSDRRTDAAQVRLVLAIVDRIAARPDLGEVRLEPLRLDDRIWREARQSGADDAIDHYLALKRQRRLPDAGRVTGRCLHG